MGHEVAPGLVLDQLPPELLHGRVRGYDSLKFMAIMNQLPQLERYRMAQINEGVKYLLDFDVVLLDPFEPALTTLLEIEDGQDAAEQLVFEIAEQPQGLVEVAHVDVQLDQQQPHLPRRRLV